MPRRTYGSGLPLGAKKDTRSRLALSDIQYDYKCQEVQRNRLADLPIYDISQVLRKTYGLGLPCNFPFGAKEDNGLDLPKLLSHADTYAYKAFNNHIEAPPFHFPTSFRNTLLTNHTEGIRSTSKVP